MDDRPPPPPWERLVDLVRAGAREDEIAALLDGLHTADIAAAVEHLLPDERADLVGLLSLDELVGAVDELADETQTEVLADTDIDRLAEMLDRMPPDEAAATVERLDEPRAEAVLALLDQDHARDIRELHSYEPETAGRIMTQAYLAVPATATAAEAVETARRRSEESETVHHILVVDDHRRLLGSVRLQDLVSASPQAPVRELMDRAIVTIHGGRDQEVAANLMGKYDLEVLPVVGDRGRLLGIITVDDILEVMHDEAGEDLFRLAGIGADNPFAESTVRRAYKRLPWLTTTLVGGVALAAVIAYFQPTLDKVLALVFFTPVLAGLSGNVGIQSSTVTVRGLATGEVGVGDVLWLIRRELLVGAVIGLTCAAALGLAAYGLLGGRAAAAGVEDLVQFCAILGLAVLGGVLVAVLIGTAAPLCCHKFGADPALAAGPFVTVVIDVVTQTLYLGAATLLLL